MFAGNPGARALPRPFPNRGRSSDSRTSPDKTSRPRRPTPRKRRHSQGPGLLVAPARYRTLCSSSIQSLAHLFLLRLPVASLTALHLLTKQDRQQNQQLSHPIVLRALNACATFLTLGKFLFELRDISFFCSLRFFLQISAIYFFKLAGSRAPFFSFLLLSRSFPGP